MKKEVYFIDGAINYCPDCGQEIVHLDGWTKFKNCVVKCGCADEYLMIFLPDILDLQVVRGEVEKVADRFLKRKATISDLRAAVKAAQGRL